MYKRLFANLQVVADFHYLLGFDVEHVCDFIDCVVMSHTKRHLYDSDKYVEEFLTLYLDDPTGAISYYRSELDKGRVSRCN